MDSRERFFATIANEPVDRPASWLGLPTPAAVAPLCRHFGVDQLDDLKRKLNDDVWHIEVPYDNPPANDIGCALDFAKTAAEGGQDERTLTAPGFFEDCEDPARIAEFPWPDPADHIRIEAAHALVDRIPADKIRMAFMWSAHFQDSCSAFGMENALITALTEPEIYQAVVDRIVEFHLRSGEVIYEAMKGKVDVVVIGNDFGSQTSLMIGRDFLQQFIFEGTRKLIAQAHAYGFKVMHHSCGSIAPIIRDLYDIGADIIHPIQALAGGMDAPSLKENFGGLGAFCGGIDAQELLVNGEAEAVTTKVGELMKIFPTGLVFSPSHEAILPDIPPANIEAVFRAMGTIQGE